MPDKLEETLTSRTLRGFFSIERTASGRRRLDSCQPQSAPEVALDLAVQNRAFAVRADPGCTQWPAHPARHEPGVHHAAEYCAFAGPELFRARSEEHTSELQSRPHLVCRL